MTSRREIIINLLKGSAVAGCGGLLWGITAEETVAAPTTLRPPGAIEDTEFLKACIKCGKCVEACPYDSLKLASPGDNKAIGTPFFEPRKIPCYMCTDFPCTEACPSGALDLKELSKQEELPDINNSQLAALLHKQWHCDDLSQFRNL